MKRAAVVMAGLTAHVVPGVASAQSETATNATAEDGAMSDIVVTAQRRGETLQSVPISVTAITADQMQGRGLVNTQDLTLSVPGLNFARSTTVAQPTMRGIGARSATVGNEGNVAIYLDGVYQAESFGNFVELHDIDQIEVLKGPQGTLYGRNALGGAIIIRTRRPSLTPTGQVTASVGRFGQVGANAFVTGPLNDKVAVSLSGNASHEDGYVRNILLDRKQGGRSNYSARGKLLFQPDGASSIMLSAYWLRNADTSNESGRWYNGNSVQRVRANPDNIPLDVLIPQGDYETSSSMSPYSRQYATGVNLDADFDLGGASLAILGSYKSSRQNYAYDNTALGIQTIRTRTKSSSWYGEATLVSQGTDKLSWIVGANIFQNKGQTDPQFAIVTTQENGVETFAVAAFGEVTYRMGQLFLTGGLRGSYEKKKSFIDILAPASSVTSARGEDSWSSLTPRAVLRYEISPHSNIYASYTGGFKSGSYDTSGVPGTKDSVDPEKVDAFEIGIKTRPAPNLRLNLSGYYYDYKDLQVQVIVTTPTSVSALLQNAATSRIKGLEGELQWQAAPGLTLNGTLSYLDARFTKFPNASVNNISYVNGLPSGNVGGIVDATGNRLIRSPEWTYTLGFDYQTALAGGTLLVNANLFHSSRYYTEVSNVRFQPAYTVVNGGVTWRAPGDQLSFSLALRNLTDERYVTQILTSAAGDYATFQRPRAWTFSVGYKW